MSCCGGKKKKKTKESNKVVLSEAKSNSNNNSKHKEKKNNEEDFVEDFDDEPSGNTNGPLIADSFDQLPDYIQRRVEKGGINIDELNDGKNFEILLNVLRFVTKKTYHVTKPFPKDKYIGFEEEEVSVNSESNPDLDAISAELLKKTEASIIVDDAAKKTFKNMNFSGKGGFGQVYFAEQNKKMVAVKKMNHITPKEIRTNLMEIAFLRECDHPNIVKYFNSYKIQNEIWVVMEFLEGGTLSEAVKEFKFKEPQVAFVAHEILKALQYLHAKKYAHRDLKSSNVMMTVQGQIKLIDFGICVDTSRGPVRHMVGSPLWIPCEMIRGRSHTYSCDIWSFAICLLEMINGSAPRDQSTMKALYTNATIGFKHVVDSSPCSDELKDFLNKCLKMVPSERATAAQLLAHPFLKHATSVSSFEDIVRSLFLSKSVLSGGIM